MERIFIKFGSEADLNYFLSVDADHFWLCRYHHIRLNNITLELDANFCELLSIEENRKILFSRRIVTESSKKPVYIPFNSNPQIYKNKSDDGLYI